MEVQNKEQVREIVAESGKYLTRKEGEPNYFTRGIMLNGETEADFVEVDKSVRDEWEAAHAPEEIV